jgi:vacuolar protein sorting-associated protein 13A/C
VGAFSKITGTLGKGLATLSMDKEYQNAKKKIDAKPNIWQNLGQNVVMVNHNFKILNYENCIQINILISFNQGVVSGFSGVVEKPFEGAKESGVLGLVGGIGKGLLGVVTKPTGGLIDFTSQSLEEIRK